MRPCLVLLFTCLLPGFATAATLYRCLGTQGEPLFSDVPCGGVAAGELPARGDHAPGTGLRASERAWLRGRESSAERRVRRRSAKPAAPARGAARNAAACARKERRIEKISARLRRGYAPAQGEKLRRRRRALEAEVALDCP